MSRSSRRVHFETSSSEDEADYILYQRLDGNGHPVENEIIRIPRSQVSNFRHTENSRDQTLMNPASLIVHNHFNINVTIPSVNTTTISRSKVSGSKIIQKQRRIHRSCSYHSKPSKKSPALQVTDDSNAERRASINEDPQEENIDSNLNSSALMPVQSGDISVEEGSKDPDESKSGNQMNYITSMKRKIDTRSRKDQDQNVNIMAKLQKIKNQKSRIRINQKVSAKCLLEASSSQITDESNQIVKYGDKAPSNQENRNEDVTLREPRKPPRRREDASMNEEFQEEGADSDANLNSSALVSVQSGDISVEEEGNQEADKSKNGNQVNYITSMNRTIDNRSFVNQGETVIPVVSQRMRSNKKSKAQSRQSNSSKNLARQSRKNLIH